jgi:hypothetical protein
MTQYKFNEGIVRSVAQGARVPVSAVKAYALASRPGQKIEEQSDAVLTQLVAEVCSSFFQFPDVAHGMQVAIVQTIRDKFYRLSTAEVTSAFGFASNGDLPEVTLGQSPTPQIFSRVLTAYQQTQRVAIIAANDREKKNMEFLDQLEQASDNNERKVFVWRASEKQYSRWNITQYALNPKGRRAYFWWLEFMTPLLRRQMIADITPEEKTDLRNKATGEARAEELEYQRSKNTLEFKSMMDIMNTNPGDVDNHYKRLYAIALIAKNRAFFQTFDQRPPIEPEQN